MACNDLRQLAMTWVGIRWLMTARDELWCLAISYDNLQLIENKLRQLVRLMITYDSLGYIAISCYN